ncbi:MAG TPA: alkaline phosphatase family protein [Candidatus Saccharimonadaceae bacterium]|jgi:hypothetical protein|nr:alkaline phosphatase family protein [Candidatus Saccharimonadaceae bacterium]
MVVLLVDALGFELATRTPGFMPALDQRRRLDTVLGFSSGALPTLFSGRRPVDHGRFLMYRRRTGTSAFRGFGALRLLPRRLRCGPRLAPWLSRVVERRGVAGYFNLYDVPRELLPEFDLPERADVFAPGGLPVDSLWDALERRGVAWQGRNWRTHEEDNLAWLEREAAGGENAFLFVYTAALDAVLHVEGGAGPGVASALARYQACVARLLQQAEARREELWVYLLSDHGMVDVHATEDVMGRLATLPFRWPRDYLAFFDSTFARFWWRCDGARDAVRAALAGARGRWLDDATLEKEGVRFPDRAYGEDLFLLDPGVLLVPSFMGARPLAAMHGYDPHHPDMAALLWSNRPIPDSVRHLTDVRAHLEAELGALAGSAA